MARVTSIHLPHPRRPAAFPSARGRSAKVGHRTRIATAALRPDQSALLFDGTCGLCSRLAEWATRADWRRKMVLLPSQTPGLLDVVGLTPADIDAAAWAITPTGAFRRGAGAVFTALDLLLPGGFPLFYALSRLPGLRSVADTVYAWVSAHRGRFGGTPICTAGRPDPLDDAVRWELERRLERAAVFGA